MTLLAALGMADTLVADLDAILDSSELKGAVVGVSVLDAEGQKVFGRNESVRMLPASCQKTLTVVFALERLGPGHRAQTRFWKEPGRVVVQATGDATLTLEDLRRARKSLQVSGNPPVHIDQAFRPGLGPGWEWDDLPYRYAAPITAFSFDQGAVDLFAENGRLAPLPPESRIQVTLKPGIGKVNVDYQPAAKHLTVKGALPKGRTRLARLALSHPDLSAALALSKGPVKRVGVALPTRLPDLVLASQPLSEVARRCLEPSDNFIAEALLFQASGTAEFGDAGVGLGTFFLQEVGLPEGSLRPKDGSGLSRHNLVSAEALNRVLLWADSRPWGPVLRQALCAGNEGSLLGRLQSSNFLGKTGTLNAVSCLSGIVVGPSGDKVAVSLLFNNALAPQSGLRRLQDEFVKRLERRWNDPALTGLETYIRW
jgi:D-alanyl-D-alanine carboxypeptidase/D-alanyl-D-alanine-endopeptidase (penicillin-binding protein 4)